MRASSKAGSRGNPGTAGLSSTSAGACFIDYAQGYRVPLCRPADSIPASKKRHDMELLKGHSLQNQCTPGGCRPERQYSAEILAVHPNPIRKSPAFMKIRKQRRQAVGQASEIPLVHPQGLRRIVSSTTSRTTSASAARSVADPPPWTGRWISFSAVCRMAIDTWRTPCRRSPIYGQYAAALLQRAQPPPVKGDEEERLLRAARGEDQERSIKERLEQLMSESELDSKLTMAPTQSIRRQARWSGRPRTLHAEAIDTYLHVPLLEVWQCSSN